MTWFACFLGADTSFPMVPRARARRAAQDARGHRPGVPAGVPEGGQQGGNRQAILAVRLRGAHIHT